MSSQGMIVVAVPHKVQGPQFGGYTENTKYAELLKQLLFDVDFIFEEASGRGPSIAKNLTAEGWAKGHYLDVDPPSDQRSHYGLSTTSFNPCHTTAWWSCQLIEEHKNREKLWLKQIKEQAFQRGLMICGLLHGLSFAFRLEADCFSDVQLYDFRCCL